MPFQQLGLAPQVIQAVKDAGYTEPTPIQTAAIPVILQRHDLMGIAQTGTGKTAAFVLPLLSLIASHPPQHRGIRGLVMVPTRELVVQVEENILTYARHLPLRVATIFGGVSERPQIRALQQCADLIVATPGRLLDVIRGREPSLRTLEFLVLDEADRMLDMGFIHPIRQIVRLLPRQRLTLLFSATLSREIEQLSREFMHHPKMVEIGRRSNPAETVTQYLYEISHHAKMSLLSHLLKNEALKTVLVFSRTKHGADRIARRLETARIPCATLHANRSQNQRLRALHDFKNGRVRVLVATDIAARGIDVEGISHVINYDFPRHPEDYVHRIGRTGRAQAVGEAISFLAPDDHSHLRTLERFLRRGILRRKVEGFTEPTNTAAPRDPSSPPPAPYRPRRDTMPWRLRRSWKNKRRSPL
ncbi:MAG: DEAD/DEAH box helicase, partial [Verrucomicrobia bacterium]|nr:DEAD/DEAH box helicase [Verrucomicrobiota bacterium]